jgi:hypothetical protein
MNRLYDLHKRYNDLYKRYNDLDTRYYDLLYRDIDESPLRNDKQHQMYSEITEIYTKLTKLYISILEQQEIEKTRTRISKSLPKDVFECTECHASFIDKKPVITDVFECTECHTSFIDNEPVITDAQLFEKLAECRCCDIHQLRRPPIYAIWQPDEIEQEAWYARNFAEFNLNKRNENKNCTCMCRYIMRRLTRIIE